jgi:hypothetical protein
MSNINTIIGLGRKKRNKKIQQRRRLETVEASAVMREEFSRISNISNISNVSHVNNTSNLSNVSNFSGVSLTFSNNNNNNSNYNNNGMYEGNADGDYWLDDDDTVSNNSKDEGTSMI